MSQPPQPAPPGGDEPVQLDPRSILYSVPTLPDDGPPLTTGEDADEEAGQPLLEDDWSQIELLPGDWTERIKQVLAEFKVFEAASRTGAGWRDVYVRRTERAPVIAGPDGAARIAGVLGVELEPGPRIYSGGEIAGKVAGGFMMTVGPGIQLYGYEDSRGVMVLGALVGRDADANGWARVFGELHRHFGFVLVDWCEQLLVQAIEDGRLQIWRP